MLQSKNMLNNLYALFIYTALLNPYNDLQSRFHQCYFTAKETKAQ